MVVPPPPAPDLSHWVIGLEECVADAVFATMLNGVALSAEDEEYEVGFDPTTGLFGIKFDVGFDKDECADCSVTFDTSLVADGYVTGVGCVLGATKAGQEDVRNSGGPLPGSGCIPGPICVLDEEECDWVGETAWSDGDRYVSRGNWATYTAYGADKVVYLYAGQTMDAGTVHFSACEDGEVTITIFLNPGWRFALDEDGDAVSENLKIQGYDEAPPASNPAPGRFNTSKSTETGMSAWVFVPCYNYYGIHVDVQWEYCP